LRFLYLSRIIKRTSLQIMLLSFITFLYVSPTYAAPPKKYGEIKNDQALVYFIRPSIGDCSGDWLYADEQFVTYVRDKTYSFAYISPGRHLIWLNLGGRITGYELEFIPGQVYYIKTGYELSFLNEATGQALINKMKRFLSPENYRAKGMNKNVKINYSKALVKENQKQKAVLPEPPTTIPAHGEQSIKINTHTPIKLKFCEDVSSAINKTGDQIRLEVAEDIFCNHQLCFRKGTPVKAIIDWAKPNGFLWKQGLLDLKIFSVPAADNTEVPTIGQLLLTGGSPSLGKQIGTGVLSFIIGKRLYESSSDRRENEYNSTKSFYIGLGCEYLGLALLKGGSAVALKGQEITIWTRAEYWIKPVSTNSPKSSKQTTEK